MPVSRVTVAICTWNRHALLRQTLEEMTRLVVPDGVDWELLVVDNNCTDDTPGVIASFTSRLPIRRVFEPTPGLSNARNRAIDEATGDYLVWTDDDVLVAPDWLAGYRDAFARWPDAVAFGGPIAPWFPDAPPSWLERTWPRVAKAYASIDYGGDEAPLTPERLPFGANMAFRTDAQRAHRYDPDRGVRPGSRMGGEETDVVLSLLAEGHTGWWVPAARVRHYIPPDRQTPAYLRRYFAAYGEYVSRYVEPASGAALFGRPRWLWRHAVAAHVAYWTRRFTHPPDVWVDDLIRASTARGRLRGYAPASR